MTDEAIVQASTCRCGHVAGTHNSGKGPCVAATQSGKGCCCGEYVDEHPDMTRRRGEALLELLELVYSLDRKYASMPVPFWALDD